MSLKDEPGSFYVVSDNMQKYAEMAKEKLSININADSSGSDHFIRACSHKALQKQENMIK